MSATLSRRWKWFLLISLAAGVLLRLLWTSDMEWKEDEYYNFVQTQLIGTSRPWPATGMPSGVYLPNPGMSVWVFVALARLVGAHDPLTLARAVSAFAILGIALIVPFALRLVREEDRAPWLWAFALAMVNPFAVYYQRKLWPEPFLPFFSMLMLVGWWRRERAWGAALWGLIGALLGQIHMSGFFYAAGLSLWTFFFNDYSIPIRRVRWRYWLLGSLAGALPLLPWLAYVLARPTHQAMTTGWSEIAQLKFWVFWVTDPLGLTLGNPLGLLRGDSLWAQISDFVRYPLLNGRPTYLNGLAHGVALLLGVRIILSGWLHFWSRILSKNAWIRYLLARKVSQSVFTLNSALWGCGILLTMTGVNIRRYYLMVCFPFQFLWLSQLGMSSPKHGQRRLAALWLAELVISASFVGYVHLHHGSIQGDYGEAYRDQRQRHLEQFGESWPDLKLLH